MRAAEPRLRKDRFSRSISHAPKVSSRSSPARSMSIERAPACRRLASSQSWDTSRCDRVAAILVFLYLLEGHPKEIAQITLTHSQFHALHPDHRTYFLVNQTIAVARHGDVSLAAESESLPPVAPSLWSATRIEALNGYCRRQLHTERAPEGAHVILIAWLLKLGSLTRPRDGGSWRIKRKTSIGVVGAIGVWCFQCHSKRKPKLSCHRRRPLAWMDYFQR